MEEVDNGLDRQSILDTVGVGDDEPVVREDADQDGQDKDDSYGIKKRLGQQAKKHQREMRQLQEQIASLHERLGSNQNAYPSYGQPEPPPATEDERIQRAVRMALMAKDHEDQKAKEAENQAHIHRRYERLQSELDKASDRYDDFDEVVRDSNAPYSNAMRDALLLIDNPADVAYKLGKDRQKLLEISKLHPLDQASEIVKLSKALIQSPAGRSQQDMNALKVKANPASNSQAISNTSTAADIRARMKAGTFK